MAAAIIARLQASAVRGIPMSLPVKIDRQIDRYLTAAAAEMDGTGIALIALSMAAARSYPALIDPRSPANWTIHCNAVGAVVATDVPLLAANITAMNDVFDEQRTFLLNLMQVMDGGDRWLLELVACNQVKSLKPKNVENYFFQNSPFKVAGIKLMHLIAAVSAVEMQLAPDAGIRAEFTQCSFIKMHISVSSTAGICQRMVEELGEYAVNVIGNNNMMLIRLAQENFWDLTFTNLIPDQIKAMASQFVKAYNMDVGDWFQGAKAVAATSPRFNIFWRAFFRKLKTIAVDEDRINGAINLTALIATATVEVIPMRGQIPAAGDAAVLAQDLLDRMAQAAEENEGPMDAAEREMLRNQLRAMREERDLARDMAEQAIIAMEAAGRHEEGDGIGDEAGAGAEGAAGEGDDGNADRGAEAGHAFRR